MPNTWRVFVADDPEPAFEGVTLERARNIAATIRWMGSDAVIEPEHGELPESESGMSPDEWSV